MRLIEQIKAAPVKPECTYKQKWFLWILTGLKFGEVENTPPPGLEQASILISYIKEYVDNQVGDPDQIVEALNLWFPNFEDPSQIHYRRGGSKKPDNGGGHSKGRSKGRKGTKSRKTEPTPQPEPQPKPQPKPEPKPDPMPKPKPAPKNNTNPNAKTIGAESIQALIEAGLRNLWMVGPAGCGKTTICQQVGDNMDLPVTVIACGAGTSATTFLGYKYPEREATPFVSAFSQPGIIVLDEFTALEAQVAQIVNAALANNQLNATTGTLTRDKDCIIIATSNTFGFGADRMYAANNQLDASTINRFACGIVEVDYSKEYESQYDMEVVRYVWRLREIIKANGMRKIASTREIINACMLKAAGLPWKESLTVNWSKDEKNHI